ncbi:MAG: hypothetical protein WD225_09715 [Ilumatobacteraceae bacterium]
MRQKLVHRMAPAAAAIGMLLLAACGESGGTGSATGGDGVVVLAKAEGWRDGLQEAAGHPYMLVEVASDRDSAQRAWDDNVPDDLPQADGDPAEPGVYGSLDEVDFDAQSVVVVSSGESGSCPAWVEELSTAEGRFEVRLATVAAEACTDDFRPYRMVLAVDRGRLPDPEDLPVDRVDVPSENLEDVEGQVVAYPVGQAASPSDDPSDESFVREDARERAMTWLGRAEDEIVESEMVRIARRGDEELPVTMDLRPGRLNLELDDDGTGTFTVTRVIVEVPDGEDPLVLE